MPLQDRLRAARGERRADLVFKGGRVLNVFTGEWILEDVAVCGDLIVGVGEYEGDTEIDCRGRSIVPGFIDAHLHVESTMLTPPALAREVLPSGTTTLIADPHEIANVAGLPGLRYFLDAAAELPCRMRVMLPSCVPATPWDKGGAILDAAALRTLREHPLVLGLGEMMDFPGVCAGEPAVMEKLQAFDGRVIDGHAPQLTGRALQAYRLAGVETDHECSTGEEALEKLRAGFAVLVREGSAAHNLTAILSAVREAGVGYDRLAFCTDDKHIEDIRRDGHIRHNIRLAMALGVEPADAYRMASWNAARLYRLRRLGAVSAGYLADLVVLGDVREADVQAVYVGGALRWPRDPNPPVPAEEKGPELLFQTVKVGRMTGDRLRLRVPGDRMMPVIGVQPGQLTTAFLREPVPERDGCFFPGNGYLKAAVVDRHHASGRVGIGIVKGLGLRGTAASTVAHDSHNLIIVGDRDEDMLLAVRELQRCGGGYTLVRDGEVLATLPLPVAGLMSDRSADEVEAAQRRMSSLARGMGLPEGIDPFQTMSFLSLPVIPSLRLTDRGVFDVEGRRYLPTE